MTPTKTYFSIIGFLDPSFFDLDHCRKWVLEALHPPEEGPECPYCGTKIHEALLPRFYANNRMVCSRCRKEFKATTGTNVYRCRLDFRQIVLLGILFESGMTYEAISYKLGASVRNLKRLVKRFDFGRRP